MVSRTRTVSLLLTGLLVLLAGCSGLLGGGAGGDGAGSNAVSVSEFDYPEGWSADGIGSVETALGTHYAVGTRGASFTEKLHVQARQGQVTNNSIRYEVDRQSRELLARLDRTEYSQVAYYGNGTLTNYDPKNGSVISRTNASFSRVANGSKLIVSQALGGLKLNASSVVEQGGVTAVRYSVTGARSNSSFTEASGTVVVASDGRILSIDVTKSNEEQTLTYRYVLEKVENTTVERPAWAEN